MSPAPAAGPPADAPLVFVDDLEAPELDDDDRHHLRRVLRVRDGDTISVGDGRGAWRPAAFGDEVEATGDLRHVDAPRPRIGVAFALVKGGRPELVTQKLTELGVDRIVPFVAERSVVRWDGERADRHVARLRRVAREAAMQARRTHLPEVAPVVEFAEACRLPGAALAERHGAPPSLDHPTVLVGPEGGWTAAERARAGSTVGLGDLVLRAETAAIAAGTLLCGLRSGLVSTGPHGSGGTEK